MHFWVLLPIIAEVEPAWIRLFNERNFPTTAPAFELLLTCDRITHIAKMLNPHNAVQVIALRKTFPCSESMLVQTAAKIVCDSDVQRRAMFVSQNVHPVVVVAHAFQKSIRDVSLRST